VNARNSATGSAALRGEELALALVRGVSIERNSRMPALLRAIVDETIFADIEVAGSGAAPPVIIEAGGDIALKGVDAGEGTLSERHDFAEDFRFALAKGLKLPAAIVQDAHR